MSVHDWYVGSRVAFVIRTLDAAEEKSFAEHLVRCEECRAAVDVVESALAWLPMGVDPVAVRPGFRGEIARAVPGGRVSTSRRWFIASAAAVVITAVGVTAALQPLRRDAVRLNAVIAMRDSQLATLRDTLAVMRESSRVLQTAITVDGRHGGLVIFADDRHRRWQVVMHGLPPAPSGQAYQFWFICDDGMIRDATLVGDPNRPALYTLVMPPNSGRVLGASLTLEPSNDGSKAPKGRELAHLLL